MLVCGIAQCERVLTQLTINMEFFTALEVCCYRPVGVKYIHDWIVLF